MLTNASILVEFQHRMRGSSINASTFKVIDPDGNDLVGERVYNPVTRTATLTPAEPLAPDSVYTAVVARNVQSDGLHRQMNSTIRWRFTTASAASAVLPSAQAHLALLEAAFDASCEREPITTPDDVYRIAFVHCAALVAEHDNAMEFDLDLVHVLALGLLDDDIRQAVVQSECVILSDDYQDLELLQLVCLATGAPIR